jgi:GDP-L-fucose synthase
MNKNDKIYVAGHRGLVGSALFRVLRSRGYKNIITRAHEALDLLDQRSVEDFFSCQKPDYVFFAAAKVGGIGANASCPADFIYQNTLMGFNVIHAAYRHGVKKLMNLGSSCIYPKMAPQPIKEDDLLSGPLEPTNDAYAIAKIAVIKLCTSFNIQYGTNYLSAMPTNLFGPGDNYDLSTSHVLPALIRKFHEAKTSGADTVELWGDGSPLREFLYSEDLAAALVFLMETYDAKDIRNPAGDFINIGSGHEYSIKELAGIVTSVVYKDAPERSCRIIWDSAKPNGTPRKFLDSSALNALGFSANADFVRALKTTYDDFQKNRKGL